MYLCIVLYCLTPSYLHSLIPIILRIITGGRISSSPGSEGIMISRPFNVHVTYHINDRSCLILRAAVHRIGWSGRSGRGAI
ncbi:hypothetical protein BV22DRAFT_872289 [Leucogyrophana mollusca]|uniref:Uncharacterized protein n=1 Tax=Leucogyrophana mollusca TaxID=85980 RepID=A0ACB8B1X1_9AGAM|nr:hypothetical protein BV22DRAFT_872289 [Leucogyrophana mollusca]